MGSCARVVGNVWTGDPWSLLWCKGMPPWLLKNRIPRETGQGEYCGFQGPKPTSDVKLAKLRNLSECGTIVCAGILNVPGPNNVCGLRLNAMSFGATRALVEFPQLSKPRLTL